MGIIYKLTSPSGKIYIGQTVKTVEKRFKEHLEDANRSYKDHCKVLNKSLRKYGGFHFKIEILESCLDENLDTMEIEYINKYKSQTPNGMNIKLGGSSGKHHEDTKKKIGASLKGRIVSEETKLKLSATKNPTLPMYLIRCKTGYRVVNHPMGPEKRFLNKSSGDEQNFKRAVSYLEKLNSLKEPIVVEKSLYEKYIQKHKNGFCVKYPNEKTKYFTTKNISADILYDTALKHLKELKSKSAVQRFDDSWEEKSPP
jgi:predicted GIY-YIG superfamily endonuclease